MTVKASRSEGMHVMNTSLPFNWGALLDSFKLHDSHCVWIALPDPSSIGLTQGVQQSMLRNDLQYKVLQRVS
jgi:hypothetical protein